MIKNILKNGKEIEDLTGYTVSREENPLVYELIESINNERRNDGDIRRDQEGER